MGNLSQLNKKFTCSSWKTCSSRHPGKVEAKVMFSLHFLFPVHYSSSPRKHQVCCSPDGKQQPGAIYWVVGTAFWILFCKCHFCVYIYGTWEIWVDCFNFESTEGATPIVMEETSKCNGCCRNPNPKALRENLLTGTEKVRKLGRRVIKL